MVGENRWLRRTWKRQYIRTGRFVASRVRTLVPEARFYVVGTLKNAFEMHGGQAKPFARVQA